MAKKLTIKQQLEAKLVGNKPPSEKIERLNKGEVSIPAKKEDGRKNNGGARPGSGHPPSEDTLMKRGFKQIIEERIGKEVDVRITDPRTGKSVVIKEPRLALAIDKLFENGYVKGDTTALNSFLDRAIGKPAQPIRGDGDSDTPVRLAIDYIGALRKGYERKKKQNDGN